MTTTHPQIDRLADTVQSHGSEELYITDLEFVFARGERFIRALVQDGKLESWQETVRAAKRRNPSARPLRSRPRYTITAGAVLVYLWKSTAGDRTALRHAIATRFPHHLAMVEACTATTVMQALLPAPAEVPPATDLPKNVLPFRRSAKAAKPAADPYAGHPDLFLRLQSQA